MVDERQVFAKCARRLIPFMALLYTVSFIDRTNVGIAALTMNKDLGFSPEIFGFGAGVFFVGYAMFQVPANVIMERIGAKRWVFCILAVWGLLSAANALATTPISFYVIRFSLGVAEAGFFPGMMLYLTYWFPRTFLSRSTANFMVAIPVSFAVGGPLSSLILEMDGVSGLHGWQWLFVIEGVPAFLLAFAVLRLMPDRPHAASWLNEEEQQTIAARLAAEDPPGRGDLVAALRDWRVIVLGAANFLLQAGGYGIALWLPQIVHATGFSNLATGFVLVVPYAASAVAMIVCGRSSTARGERIWHVALPWLVTAAAFAIASVAKSNAIVLATIAIAMVASLCTYGPFYSLPSSFLRGAAAAGGIALCSTFGSLGGFFGPALLGVLKQGSGDYASGMAAVAFGFVLAALILLALGRAITVRPATPAQAAGVSNS
jgi:MFS transporter, ACS family, tartrate transporter